MIDASRGQSKLGEWTVGFAGLTEFDTYSRRSFKIELSQWLFTPGFQTWVAICFGLQIEPHGGTCDR